MRYFHFVLLTTAMLTVAVSPLAAQLPNQGPVRGGPNPFAMIRQKSVQDELKMSKEQQGKLKEVMTGIRDQLLELIENGEREKARALIKKHEKDILTVLTSEQVKRLKEIILQVHGIWAMTVPETAKELQITAEQKEKILALQTETEKQMKKIFEGEAASRKEAQQKMAELHKSANDKALLLFTDAQKAKWKEMAGEPFKGEIRREFAPARRPGQSDRS
jgi:Spy/CpxP family protein refolding chaperone